MLNEKLAAAGGETVQISDDAKEQHTKQVAALRDEVAEKSRKIEELTVSRFFSFIFYYNLILSLIGQRDYIMNLK